VAAAPAILLAALVVIAAGFDLRTRRIPNWLCAAGFVGGFACQIALYRWMGVRGAILGAGLALLIYIPLFALRAVGGGDVKLMTAVGAIAGPAAWLAIFIVTAIVGGAMALLLIATKKRMRRTLKNVGVLLTELVHLRAPHRAEEELDVTGSKGLRLPHGLTIAVGTLMYLAYAFGCSISGGASALR
jgi:prepilin peptidase CpaA